MTSRWHFEGEPSAVGEARRRVEEALAGRPGRVVETASLLVSELATNAVCHARSSFDVDVAINTDDIRIEVHDTGRGEPVIRAPELTDASGRGLQIVELLADEWGVRHAGGHHKVIWFKISPNGTGAPAP